MRVKRGVQDNGACKATANVGGKTIRETANWIYIPPVAKAAFTNPAIKAPDVIKLKKNQKITKN